jgi:hypothetical protein
MPDAPQHGSKAAYVFRETGQLGTVQARIARKGSLAALRLLCALVQQSKKSIVRAERAGEHGACPGIAMRELPDLVSQLVQESSRKKEVRHDDDPVRLSARDVLESFRQPWTGNAREARLRQHEASSLSSEPHELAKVSVGIGIAGASTYDDECSARNVGVHRRDRCRPLEGQLRKIGMHAKRRPGGETDVRELSARPRQSKRNIVLDVAGGEQEERHNDDLASVLRQVGQSFVQRRARQLDIGVGNARTVLAARSPDFDAFLELVVRGRFTTAVTEH